MKPEIFRLPFVNLPIHGYGLMIVIGFLLATWLATREARRKGLPEIIYDLGVVMLLSGLLGGRVFYYFNYYSEYQHAPWYEFFAIWKGGLAFHGGAIGGALGGLLFLKWKNAPILEMLDVVTPFVPIGMGFGRLGCFLKGCCFGKICSENFPLGVSFPRWDPPDGAFEAHVSTGRIPEDALYSLPVYPVQLFEAGLDFLTCGLLWWYFRGPAPRGGGFPLLFLLYGIGRFHMELLRGDHPETWLGLTEYQVISLGLIVVFGSLFAYLWKRPWGTDALAGSERPVS